jgi:hypothetical protein
MLPISKRITILSAMACIAMGGVAKADIVPTLQSISPDPAGHRWTYEALVGIGQRVETGDFFTIYDFLGFVSGTNSQPEGWTFSAQPFGVTPVGVVPPDTSTVNLTWTRTGGTVGTGEFPEELGEFSAVSTIGTFELGFFAGRGTKTTEPEEGTKVANTGQVPVPVPLPAAALMFPLGAVVAGLAYRRMRRNV